MLMLGISLLGSTNLIVGKIVIFNFCTWKYLANRRWYGFSYY